MSVIPPNIVTEADVAAWYEANEALKKAKAAEMLLRLRVFGAFFPAPVEGTNTVTLPAVNGVPFALKAKYPINRKVDPALLEVMKEAFAQHNISVDKLIKYTPELVLSEYRTLTAEETSLFDRVLDIKPGTPALEVAKVLRAPK